MRPPGWPARVADPDSADFPESAIRWLWDVGSIDRSPGSVWARHPRALAFRVSCDLEARVESEGATASAIMREALRRYLAS